MTKIAIPHGHTLPKFFPKVDMEARNSISKQGRPFHKANKVNVLGPVFVGVPFFFTPNTLCISVKKNFVQ